MKWSKFKKEFQKVLLERLDSYYQDFHNQIRTDETWWTYDAYKDMEFKEFMKKLTLKSHNDINSMAWVEDKKSGYEMDDFIEFQVGPAQYMLLDNPCVLATVYKNSNRRI